MASHRYPRDAFAEIGVPDLGMDTDTVPRLMPPRKAPLLKNFLMDRPGILPMRGPICEGTTWNLGASIGLLGAWVFDDKVLISRYAASGTATRDYWVAPYRQTTSAPSLRQASTTMKLVDLTAGTVTDVTAASRGGVIGLRAVRVGAFAYGPAADSTALDLALTAGGVSPIVRSRTLLAWDGSSTTPTLYTNGPKAVMSVAYHYNRIFALGGRDPASPRLELNSLFWTDQLPTDGTALPDTAAAWQDDVTGLVNRIVIGASDDSDFGVALAHVGPNLLILKRRSLWMLYGTSPANFSVRQISNEIGCIDPRSVVEYDGGVFFMSDRGFMYYDGAHVRDVSKGLTSALVASALKQCGPQGVDGGYVRAVLLDRGYVLVTTGITDGTTLTTTVDTDAWLLHAPSGAWQQLSSGALASIAAGGRTTNYSWLMTDTKLVKANYLFNPGAAPAGTRGFDSIDSGATKFVIPSRWTTRTLELSAPTSKSKLQRIMAEYYWGLANGGWTVTATARGPAGVVSPSAVLGAPTTVAATLPARGTLPIFNETDEVYLDVAATSSAPAAFNDAELHRLLIEYEPTGNTVPL